MSKQQTAVRSAAAGSPSDIFRQRPRFFAFYTFFSAVGTVEVPDGFIDRLTNCKTGKFQALKIQGGSAPFFRSVLASMSGRFLRRWIAAILRLSPSLTHSLPLSYLLGWERIYISPVSSAKTSRNFNFQQSPGKDVKNMNIGIDHGYYAIKTRHFSFPAGIAVYSHEPYTLQNTLEYGGIWHFGMTVHYPATANSALKATPLMFSRSRSFLCNTPWFIQFCWKVPFTMLTAVNIQQHQIQSKSDT